MDVNNDKSDGRRSAQGLHKAVRSLRDKTRLKVHSIMMSDPIVWAPFIHIGICYSLILSIFSIGTICRSNELGFNSHTPTVRW